MCELVREFLSSPQIKQDSSSECTKQDESNDQESPLDPSSHHHHHYYHYHNHYNTTYCTHNNINNCQYVQVGNGNIMERVPEYLSEPPSDVEHWDVDNDLG
ncbi:uncharacterized protein LOC106171851 [Lingula anatina]|uniref:Uncharacterized protein LOC106171851 n=1 Tax=Lingula anatina TaxID=7574 RepID=A0A1S3JBL0_LINAN|nr:uncharacterized protein LOC106171851 [Lingula anatina]|eukprot:XP_013407795.1 uncharacterized protein LOC106171851 [Lingula anatina]